MPDAASHHWSPDEMDRLERAIVEGDRVRISRRGNEYVVQPREIVAGPAGDVLVASAGTGDRFEFPLDEVDDFDVI